MPHILSLFEYRSRSFDQMEEQVRGLFADDDFVNGLEKFLEKSKLSSALSIGRKSVSTKSFVGTIKYKNLQIEILPKLLAPTSNNDAPSEQDKKSILNNLLYMLSYTKKLNIRTTNIAKLSESENTFIETLIQIYANNLSEALKRFLPKNYINISDNINFIRGRINIQKNIQHNYINKAKIFCDFDEFSENNPLNQLFLYVSSMLRNLSKVSTTKKKLQFIINYYSDISFKHFSSEDLTNIHLTREQSLFQQAFTLAKMFIENSSVDMSKNRFNNISLVWNMNKLFEEFVTEFLQRNKDKINKDVAIKIDKISAQYKKKLLKSQENNNKYLLPSVDIYITTTQKGSGIVLDTKYKSNNGEYGEAGTDDIFQVTTYCKLHGSKEAILLYPSNTETIINPHPYNLNVDNDKVDNINITTALIDIKYDDLSKRDIQNKLIESFQNILKLKPKKNNGNT